MTVDDELLDDGDEPEAEPEPKRPGPTDKTPRRGGRAKQSKPGPSTRARMREQSKRGQREQAISAAIAELVELADSLRGRGGQPADDVADIARRDGDLMADVLAELADRFDPLALIVDNALGLPVKAVRAFGPILRKLLARSRELRQRRDEVAEEFARRLLGQAVVEGKGEPRDGERMAFEGAVWEFNAASNGWVEVPAAQLEAEARALQ